MLIFGDRLRELRNAKQLSQSEFAKQLQLSKSAVNMYERGEREPSFEILEKIADYFNVDLDYLLGKTDCKNRAPQYVLSDFEFDSKNQELIAEQDEKEIIIKQELSKIYDKLIKLEQPTVERIITQINDIISPHLAILEFIENELQSYSDEEKRLWYEKYIGK